tara:strand:+ start:323 stop:445 length:123 start_codon:yes stop_codon:yes gene_type:complete
MKCLKCSYDWTPRVEKPKECPECKTRLKLFEKAYAKHGGK